MDKNNRNYRNNSYFRDFYSEDKVKSKLEKKELVKGTLINEGHKWFVEINHKKIYINSEKDRNRAFNNDSVVVEIDPKNKESGIAFSLFFYYFFLYIIFLFISLILILLMCYLYIFYFYIIILIYFLK